jgi:uncharacterized RDD family membrane protein YckC
MAEPQVRQSPAGDSYAGFGRRFLAYFLDQVILSVSLLAALFILAFIVGAIVAFTSADAEAARRHVQEIRSSVDNSPESLWSFMFWVASWLYYAVLESSSKQSTYGKRILGLQVTDENGSRISFARASGRFWGKLLSYILLLGFIAAAFTKRKQAFHDKWAHTLVVRKSAMPLAGGTGQSPTQLVDRSGLCEHCGEKWVPGNFCRYCGTKRAA